MPQLLHQLSGGADHLIDDFRHVNGNADGAGLVGNGASDRLPDPPGGIGGKLVAAAIFKLVHRLHQAHVAFLDQVQELQAAVVVFLGDRDHQAKIGLHQLALGLLGVQVSLDDFALGPAQLLKPDAGFTLKLLEVGQAVPL